MPVLRYAVPVLKRGIMQTTKEIIVKLKEVKAAKGYSYADIMEKIEGNGGFVSKSTISRVFKEGSEEDTFRYEDTLRPIADALLGIETPDAGDDEDTKARKTITKLKGDLISNLEKENAYLKAENEKYRKDYEHNERLISFLQKQVDFKDDRMDKLLEAVFHKDEQLQRLMEQILSCPCRMEKR